MTLRGAVECDKLPVANAKVSLTPIPAEPDAKPSAVPPASAGPVADSMIPAPSPQSVRADDDGLFLFSKMPQGKYKLRAEGIIRNKTRKAELEITIDEQTPFKPAPRLKLE